MVLFLKIKVFSWSCVGMCVWVYVEVWKEPQGYKTVTKMIICVIGVPKEEKEVRAKKKKKTQRNNG